MLWWFIGAWFASGTVVPVVLLLRTAWRAAFAPDAEPGQTPVLVAPHCAATPESTGPSGNGLRRLAASALRLLGNRGGAQTTAKLAQLGRYVLSGLVSVCALFLLYVSSFSESINATRNLPAASTNAQASTQAAAAETMPAQFAGTLTQAGTDGEAAARSGLPREPASPDEAEQVTSIQPPTGDAGERAGADASRQIEAAAPLLTAPASPKPTGAERGLRHRRVGAPMVGPYVTRSSRGTWLFAPNSNGGANS